MEGHLTFRLQSLQPECISTNPSFFLHISYEHFFRPLTIMAVAVMSAAWPKPSRRTRLGAVRSHPSTWTPTTSGHVVTVAVVFTVTSN